MSQKGIGVNINKNCLAKQFVKEIISHRAFMSIFLFCFGLLVLKSKYMPFIIGIFLIVGSFGFPINTFTKILIPSVYPATFTQFAMLGGAIGGALPMLWLLIMGMTAPQPSIDDQKVNYA